MNDLKKHRRQAAWLCFEPHLPETQRIQAIQILERSYQIDSISNLIAYVTKICSEFGIEAQQRRSLYVRFNQLMTEKLPSSIDPLTLILEIERSGEESLKATEPTLPPEIKHVLEEPKPTHYEPTPAVESPPLPDHTIIFICFIKYIVGDLLEPDAFFAIIEEGLTDNLHVSKELNETISNWLSQPDDFAWTKGLDEKILASVVHQIYMGLCEILGPVGADDAFHKAIAKCEQTPEAKRFSPSRFL